MNTYNEQVFCINKIAKHFAIMGYHVTTTFYSKEGGCEVTIFFHDINLSESIESYLLKYADSADRITFDSFERDDSCNKFYTYKLQKHPL